MFMMFQTTFNVDIQLLLYLIPVTLGVQMAFYFYLQYNRARAAKVRLNRILISFGTFTLLIVFGALCLNIDRLFGPGNGADTLLRKLGYTLALLSPFGFMGFIAIPEFHRIINVKAAWILLALSTTPIIVLFVDGTHSPLFPPAIIFTALNAYYLVQFQVKMIRISLGSIRKKITLTFVGELIALSSLAFAVNVGLENAATGSIETTFFIGVGILTTGFLIMFIAANDFPPFLEFDWRSNLRRLVIFDETSNAILFTRDFESVPVSDERTAARDEIFPGGIAGIEKLVATVTGDGSKNISRIDQEGSFIL